jgi:hypothetical protein
LLTVFVIVAPNGILGLAHKFTRRSTNQDVVRRRLRAATP